MSELRGPSELFSVRRPGAWLPERVSSGHRRSIGVVPEAPLGAAEGVDPRPLPEGEAGVGLGVACSPGVGDALRDGVGVGVRRCVGLGVGVGVLLEWVARGVGEVCCVAAGAGTPLPAALVGSGRTAK